MRRIQITASAPTAPTAMVMPAPPSGFPAARDMSGAMREAQGSICTLPMAVRVTNGARSVRGTPTLKADAMKSGFGTGSPDAVHSFMAPSTSGVTSEADFVGASLLGGAVGPDPFAGLLSGSVEMVLDMDIDGRVAEAVDNLKKNACGLSMLCLLCPIVGWCIVGQKMAEPDFHAVTGHGSNAARARTKRERDHTRL